MKSLLILFLSILTFHSVIVSGQNIKLKLTETKLTSYLLEIEYPERLVYQELKSGLPNMIDFIIKLKDETSQISRQKFSLIITYDLWDEHYSISRLDSGSLTQQLVKDENELKNAISNIAFADFYTFGKRPSTDAQLNKEYSISIQVLFNPVRAERVKKILNWIRTSNGYDEVNEQSEFTLASRQSAASKPPSNPVNIIAGDSHKRTVNSGGPRFQKLFDKILEQQMSDDQTSAQWKSQVITQSFTLKSLAREDD
ncbi:hypothetical protein [Aliikangiella coralliicola]|uniref:DUF4390 domain-containing protein n=1 Tax=Aliikangiella coralliicola TaxID=2592383 RepID=A0A545UJN4_9GAMM|nr:hypothetical protein [Aliikangiella coralliicola]TQV89672.1 hypothetical protein FLL46_01960 [Aliikangiella coralliicola]